jgi:mRNA interferase MazF
MVKKIGAPIRGGIYKVNFDPTRGHEQRGFRPSVVVSSQAYNSKTGLALICPVTSVRKGYPFEVYFDVGTVSGVILADQIRSIDWNARRMQRVGDVPVGVLAELQAKCLSLLR